MAHAGRHQANPYLVRLHRGELDVAELESTARDAADGVTIKPVLIF